MTRLLESTAKRNTNLSAGEMNNSLFGVDWVHLGYTPLHHASRCKCSPFFQMNADSSRSLEVSDLTAAELSTVHEQTRHSSKFQMFILQDV